MKKILRLCCIFAFILPHSSSLRIVEHPEDTFVHRNDPATLNCRAEGEQNPIITWYRNGEKIEKSSAYKILRSNGQLYFPSVDYLHHFFASGNNKPSKALLDTGTYYCNATDPKSGSSVISRNATLQVKDSMLEEFKDASILSTETPLGEPVALQCKLQHTDHHSDANQGGTGVTWMKDGTVVEGGDRVKVEWNGTLYLQEVKKEDAGFYTCLIFSSTGPKESRPVRLMVLEKPHIKEGPVGIKVEFGADAMFHCRASGDPEPVVSWRRKGGHLPQNRSKVLGSQSLFLSNVQVEDEGEYVCVVENTVGRDEKSAKLVVHADQHGVVVIELILHANDKTFEGIKHPILESEIFNTFS